MPTRNKKPVKSKEKAQETGLFSRFNVNQGFPGKIVRRKNKAGRFYYVITSGEFKGRRTGREYWEKFRETERKRVKTGKKKKPVLLTFENDAFHHKSFLSYLQDAIYTKGYKVKIKGSKKEYTNRNNFSLFQGLKKMYSDNVTQAPGSSEDLLYFGVTEDMANKIIYLDPGEIFTSATEIELNLLDYL